MKSKDKFSQESYGENYDKSSDKAEWIFFDILQLLLHISGTILLFHWIFWTWKLFFLLLLFLCR